MDGWRRKSLAFGVLVWSKQRLCSSLYISRFAFIYLVRLQNWESNIKEMCGADGVDELDMFCLLVVFD